jgi:HSP20 family protein
MGTAVAQKENRRVAVKSTTPGGLLDSMFNSFDAISRRAFEIFESSGRLDGHDVEDWLQAERELFHPVHIELTESDESISVNAEVPGFNEKELEVAIEPTRLTISGKRESRKEGKKGKTAYSETYSNEIFRVVELPAEVDTGEATATLNDGILQLAVPKAAKARTVPIGTQAVS